MRYIKSWTAYVLAMSILAACNKAEPVPAYVYVEQYTIIPTADFGTASSQITDVWVYENDNLQGVYEMPVTFPILSSGKTTLKLLAGIKMNGIAATRVSYPFYAVFEAVVELKPAETDTLYPVAGYIPATIKALMEDFETGNLFQGIERITADEMVFEGQACGRLKITPSDSIVLAYSNNRFSIPFVSDAVFVEMNYKNAAAFTVGVRGYQNAQVITAEKLTVIPRATWNKIYINFTPEIRRIQATEYELIFKYVGAPSSNPPDILIDNIKILYL